MLHGDGETCSFWLDVWHGDEALPDIRPAVASHCTRKDATVKEVLQTCCRKRRGMSCSLWRGFLQKLSCLRNRIKDRRLSSKNNSGLESGAIYQLLKARGQPSDDRATFVWCNAAPSQVQMFMWLLLQGRIQCRTVLHRKHVLPDAISEICKEDDESPEHIISGCPIGKQFWEKLGLTSMVGADVRNIHRTIPPRGIPKEEFAAFVALSCW